MNRLLRKLLNVFSLNLNTLRFNFHYFGIKQALRFPVLVSSNVLLLKLGGKVILSEPYCFGKIRIGYGNVGIFDKRFLRSIWELQGSIEFKGIANIGHGSKISVGKKGMLTIGDNFIISAESSIVAFKNITIGNDCLISWNTIIIDTDFHTITDLNKNILNEASPITIGNKIWIGMRCIILKGSEISSNCVIGCGSIVSGKLIGENQLIVGSPAKPVRSGIYWDN